MWFNKRKVKEEIPIYNFGKVVYITEEVIFKGDKMGCILMALKGYFTTNGLLRASGIIEKLSDAVMTFEHYETTDTATKDAFIDTLIAILQSEKSTNPPA